MREYSSGRDIVRCVPDTGGIFGQGITGISRRVPRGGLTYLSEIPSRHVRSAKPDEAFRGRESEPHPSPPQGRSGASYPKGIGREKNLSGSSSHGGVRAGPGRAIEI